MKNKTLLILLLLVSIIILGSYILFNKQKTKNIVENINITTTTEPELPTTTTTTTIQKSNNNIYRDEINGFEFIMPNDMKIAGPNSEQVDELLTEGGKFDVTISAKQEYIGGQSAFTYNKYFYDLKDNSWYHSLVGVEINDLGEYKDVIYSTEKFCGNKEFINSQPFYKISGGDEGLYFSGIGVLLNNGKFIEFIASNYVGNPDHENESNEAEKEIREALSTFKTIGQVKIINSLDCK